MRASVMPFTVPALIALIAACAVACREQSAPRTLESTSPSAPPTPLAPSSVSSPRTGPGAGVGLVRPAVPAGVAPCGELDCLAFPDALSAFRFVLAHEPRVLALGEAHAQRGTETIASSTKRFTETLLPELRGKATGIVLELWLGEPKCGSAVAVAREQQKPVTAGQAKSNPNEIVALGDRAYALGIRPFPLRPSCEDYAPIVAAADAGADTLTPMLELIERLSEARMKALLATPSPSPSASASHSDAGGMVLGYGGALHNDADPAPGKEGFSFGPAMTHATDGRYIELDLIVGDFVRNEEPWTRLAWVKPYLAKTPRDPRTLLYRPGPASFVLVFP